MDVNESPLNVAHAVGRRAEKYQSAQKWKEAIECHEKAIDLLGQALSLTMDPLALQSVRLQQDYHRRQIALLHHRQLLFPAVNSNMESNLDLRVELDSGENNPDVGENRDSDSTEGALQTLEDCDSMLQMLNKRAGLSDSVPNHAVVAGVKTEKQTDTIIEELRIQNEELRFHIMRLLQENQQQAFTIATLRNSHSAQMALGYQGQLEQQQQQNIKAPHHISTSGTDVDPPSNEIENVNTGLNQINSLVSAENVYRKRKNVSDNTVPSGSEESEEDEGPYVNCKGFLPPELPPLEVPQFDFDSTKS